MRPCDVYIALGTVYEKSFISAKKKFQSITILEWGSKHINSQIKYLSKAENFKSEPRYFIDKALRGYEICDYISIPSKHVEESFLREGISQSKIIRNLYGVDLNMFRPTKLDSENAYDLIFVGGWSYTKGCDLLYELCKKTNYRLLHVGAIGDLDFPDLVNMTHIDSVDQKDLIKYYGLGKIFVLPSRSDGFGMVLSQAIACGLPIVCSKDTGGPDLKETLTDTSCIIEMKHHTLEELESCVKLAFGLPFISKGERSYAGCEIDQLTWKMYGIRYNDNLVKMAMKNLCEIKKSAKKRAYI
jgi:hypothetical protein